MIKVYFMRHSGKRQKRGYIADIPNDKPCYFTKPFIICQFDETILKGNTDILTDDTVHLKLGELMLRYPDSVRDYTDLDGNIVEVPVYGYFSEQGNSVTTGCPIITMEDIDYE